MDGRRYPPATAVAPLIEAHFARHIAASGSSSTPATVVPPKEAIEAVIDAAFWASLRREEGYIPRISLALLPADRATEPLLFERPLPLVTSALVHVAPAV